MEFLFLSTWSLMTKNYKRSFIATCTICNKHVPNGTCSGKEMCTYQYSWSIQFGTLKSCHFWNIVEHFCELFGGFWKNWDVPRDFWNISILNVPSQIEDGTFTTTQISWICFFFCFVFYIHCNQFCKNQLWIETNQKHSKIKKIILISILTQTRWAKMEDFWKLGRKCSNEKCSKIYHLMGSSVGKWIFVSIVYQKR